MDSRTYGIDLSELDKIFEQLSLYHREEIPPDYWHGYLTAIALRPTAQPENQWMGIVLGREPGIETAEVEESLRGMLGGIIDTISNQTFVPYFPGDRSSWQDCTTHNWCEGFLTASCSWPEDLQLRAGEELLSLTLPVVIFYDPAEYFEEHGTHLSRYEREEILDQTFAFLPRGLYEIPSLWGEVLQVVDDD